MIQLQHHQMMQELSLLPFLVRYFHKKSVIRCLAYLTSHNVSDSDINSRAPQDINLLLLVKEGRFLCIKKIEELISSGANVGTNDEVCVLILMRPVHRRSCIHPSDSEKWIK